MWNMGTSSGSLPGQSSVQFSLVTWPCFSATPFTYRESLMAHAVMWKVSGAAIRRSTEGKEGVAIKSGALPIVGQGVVDLVGM